MKFIFREKLHAEIQMISTTDSDVYAYVVVKFISYPSLLCSGVPEQALWISLLSVPLYIIDFSNK
jgi:hypothetical protein